MIVETCCDSITAMYAAVIAGTDRIELCYDLSCGGVSPHHADIDEAGTLKGLPVNVLIRPRGGDFVYDEKEIEKMFYKIAYCANCGLNGVVIGALTKEGDVDMELCRELVSVARTYGLSVTFHRAIDEARDIFQALEDVILLGVDRVLTSGGAPDAWTGRETIRRMVEQAAGRTIILPGGGVTPENAVALAEYTGVTELHGTRTGIVRAVRGSESYPERNEEPITK